MDETLFYVFGISLAVLAVVVSFIGIKSEKFPGKAGPAVVVLFLALAAGAATFAVIHAQEENKHTLEKYNKANEEIEAEEQQQREDNEAAGAEEGGASEGEGEMGASEGEGESGMTGSAEAGAVVFTSAGCSSCHTFAAAESSGVTGPNLDETLAPDDTKESIEEMIVDPNKEIVPGYSDGIMPTTFGESLSEEELANVVEFLYVNSPAGKGA